MLNKHNLASEILTRVFQFLSPIDRRTRQFVCKGWNLPAKQVYFSSIITSKSGSLSNLLYSLKINGSLVQSLVINWNIKLHSFYFHQLLRYCSQLITLCLNEGYVGWLSISLIELNTLKVLNMEGDTLHERPKNDLSYYRTAYRFCSSLEEIEILSLVDQDLFQEFGGVTKYLSNFKNLKRLKFDGGNKAPIYLGTLLNTCIELNKPDIHLDNSSLYSPIVALNRQIAHYSSIRQLKIDFTKFSIENLQYLVDKYINLSKLYVHIDDQQYLDWQTNEYSVRSFMKSVYFPFLHTLKDSSFAFNTDQPIVIRKISKDILNSFDKLKTVCCRFKKDVRENASMELKTKQDSAHLNMTFLHPEYDLYLLTVYSFMITAILLNH